MLAAWFRAGLVAAGLSTAAMVACSSSSTAPAAATPAVACPASLQAALTATCGSASESCAYLYSCGEFSAPATCACDSGRFSCVDVANIPIEDDGSAPTCSILTADKGCPLSESAASMMACSELGLQCAYPSVCKGIAGYDTCQCNPDPTGGGAVPHFECLHVCDLFPDASPPEASLPDAPPDSPADAPPDAPADAPQADAHPEASAPADAPTD